MCLGADRGGRVGPGSGDKRLALSPGATTVPFPPLWILLSSPRPPSMFQTKQTGSLMFHQAREPPGVCTELKTSTPGRNERVVSKPRRCPSGAGPTSRPSLRGGRTPRCRYLVWFQQGARLWVHKPLAAPEGYCHCCFHPQPCFRKSSNWSEGNHRWSPGPFYFYAAPLGFIDAGYSGPGSAQETCPLRGSGGPRRGCGQDTTQAGVSGMLGSVGKRLTLRRGLGIEGWARKCGMSVG